MRRLTVLVVRLSPPSSRSTRATTAPSSGKISVAPISWRSAIAEWRLRASPAAGVVSRGDQDEIEMAIGVDSEIGPDLELDRCLIKQATAGPTFEEDGNDRDRKRGNAKSPAAQL